MSIATAFLQADLPVGFVLLLAFGGILATLILFCLFTLRHANQRASLRRASGPKTHSKTRWRGATRSNTPFQTTKAATRSPALFVHIVCAPPTHRFPWSLPRFYPPASPPNHLPGQAALTGCPPQ